jgi:hypothetical protein
MGKMQEKFRNIPKTYRSNAKESAQTYHNVYEKNVKKRYQNVLGKCKERSETYQMCRQDVTNIPICIEKMYGKMQKYIEKCKGTYENIYSKNAKNHTRI